MSCWVSVADIYFYGGFFFEWHNYLGPTKLNKDLEPSKRSGRKFYKVINKWDKLSKKAKEKTRHEY